MVTSGYQWLPVVMGIEFSYLAKIGWSGSVSIGKDNR